MSARRVLTTAAVLAVAAAGIWTALTYPRLGQFVYHHAARAEAQVYGFRTETVQISDARLVIYRGGTPAAGRETLVLLHGYSADRQVWPRFAKHLLDRYDIVIPDLAGHGDSGFTAGLDYSAPAQARRVIELMDALKIPRAHVIGNSMGGFIAAHLGRAYPARIASATLIDAAGVLSPQPSDMDRMLAEGRNPFEVHSAEEFRSFYAMTMAKPPFLPGFVLDGMARTYEQRREELAEIFKGFHHHDMLDAQLDSITVPVLIIWGRLDRLIDVSAVEVWSKGLPQAQVKILEGIGHMPMVETPKQTAALVADFLPPPAP